MKNKILQELPGIQKDVLMKNYTTYKIGGPAKYFFVAKTNEDLVKALRAAKNFKLPVFILGGGSNLLVSDKGLKGLVIKVSIDNIELDGNAVTAAAGVNLTKLANLLAKNNLTGFEWASGIPGGTVGGAIYGHAQAFGTKISSSVESVRAVNLKNFRLEKFSKKQCKFSLKSSIFKKRKDLIIVSVVFKFKKAGLKEIQNKTKEFLTYRKTRHPLNFPSAGSTFVNPEKRIKNRKLLEKFPELENYNKIGVIPAGYLIEKCGLSGKKVGGAQISEKHANFIINIGGARAKDVMALMSLAKKEVKKCFGISLESEVQFAGFY